MARGLGEQEGASDPHSDVTGALHDVSNALTVILGWVAEARASAEQADAVAHALQVIEQQARLARDLARRAIGVEPTLAERHRAVGAVVDEVISALQVVAHRAGVQLEVQRGTPELRVLSPGDLAQVVTNLVLNALDHAPRGTRVSVEIGASDRGMAIDVQDEGRGVPEARKQTIFEGDSARPGGAGVGLVHSRGLARAAGGELELLPSQAGARFRVTWQRVDAPPSLPPPPMSSSRVLSGTRVLIVEDDAHVTMLLETALGARGAVVTVARDARELEQAVADGEHDAALIDLSPIASDVEGAVAALRERSPQAALVFISGSALGLPEALEEEGVRWVRKPFEVGELVEAVLSARGQRSR